jgi:hypothetical protein
MDSDYEIGDQVRYIPGYKGYHAAEVMDYDGTRPVIEFSSDKQITCWPEELEEA